jgi:voltage-gated potassium channel Kch
VSEPFEFIIAGFGVPGRQVAEALCAQKRSFSVIEMNPKTVMNCTAGGVHIIAGDASQPEVLRQAGIETARALVVAVPNDEAALEILRTAKSVNPAIRVVVRCSFSSTGIQALKWGASEVVVAEQVVGQHLTEALIHGHQSHS